MFQELLTQGLKIYCESKGLPVLGPEYTLAQADTAGRPDVVLSNAIAAEARKNPVSAAIHEVARPYVDGIIVSQLGPQRLKARLGTPDANVSKAKKRPKSNGRERRLLK